MQTPPLLLRGDVLRRQVQPVSTHLELELDGTRLRRELVVLGFWDWSHEASARRTIAAFVNPSNPLVEQVICEAQAESRNLAGADRFDDLLRTGREGAAQCVLQALYRYLADRRSIQWMANAISTLPGVEGTFQTIRPPHRIFGPGTGGSDGEASCLDLSVLTAACRRRTGLFPVLIFVGDQLDRPDHALVGCWVGSTPGGRPVIDDAGRLDIASRFNISS